MLALRRTRSISRWAKTCRLTEEESRISASCEFSWDFVTGTIGLRGLFLQIYAERMVYREAGALNIARRCETRNASSKQCDGARLEMQVQVQGG